MSLPPRTNALHEKCIERDTHASNDYMDMMTLAAKLERALIKIRDQDYRGNQCSCAAIAEKALNEKNKT